MRIPPSEPVRSHMALNKKQKKQLDVARKKLASLQRLLSDAKQQQDDPQELVNLQRQIAEVESQIEKIQAS